MARGRGALFDDITGIALDGAGYAYVTDEGNKALRMISPSGIVTTIAGGPQTASGFADGTGDVALLGGVFGIAVTPDGNSIYFGSTNTIRIAQFTGSDRTNPQSWTISTIAGDHTDSSDITEGLGTVARFESTHGLAIDISGNLIVADNVASNIRQLTFLGGDRSLPTSWNVSLLAGSPTGALGHADGDVSTSTFDFPSGVAVDRLNNVYVTDTLNDTIRKISLGNVSTIAGVTGTAAPPMDRKPPPFSMIPNSSPSIRAATSMSPLTTLCAKSVLNPPSPRSREQRYPAT